MHKLASTASIVVAQNTLVALPFFLMALWLLLLLSVSVSALSFCSRYSAGAKLVASLPGFDGALPFRLETGYVSVDEDNGAEMFYYFIESEGDDSSRDPVLLWLTGGDRCSVLSGLLFEIGPLRFIIEPYDGTTTSPRLLYHPYSWTKAASILFVDTPVGAGFSFSRKPRGYDVGEVSTSLQLKKFVTKWFIEHPDYLSNPFYIGGDSYAGKIVPFVVQKISEDIEAGLTPTPNLKGYLVGNPATGESIDFDSRVPYAHGVGIISDQLYETIMEHCQGENYSNPKDVICARALDSFNKLLGETGFGNILENACIYDAHGPNIDGPADRKIMEQKTGLLKHPPARPPMDCVLQTYGNYLSYFWANNRITREALGIKKGTVDEWVRCRHGNPPYSRDIKSNIKYHRNVTSKGYRALIYRLCTIGGNYSSTVVPFVRILSSLIRSTTSTPPSSPLTTIMEYPSNCYKEFYYKLNMTLGGCGPAHISHPDQGARLSQACSADRQMDDNPACKMLKNLCRALL